MPSGVIGDMSVTENAIAESYRKPPFFRRGFLDWPGGARASRSRSSPTTT